MPIGEARVLAQPPNDAKAAPATAPAAQPIPQPANKPFNIALVPANAHGILALKPVELLAHPAFEKLYEQLKQLEEFRPLRLVNAREIEQLVAFAEFFPRKPKDSPGLRLQPGFVIRSNRPQDWSALLKLLIQKPEEVRHEGQVFTRWQGAPGELSAYAPDAQTLVLALEESIRQVIEDREASPPRRAWGDVWSRVEKSQIAVAVETRSIREMIATGRPEDYGVVMGSIAPLLEKSRGYAAGASFTYGMTLEEAGRAFQAHPDGIGQAPRLSLDVEAVCGTEDNAKSVADTVRSLLTLGRNSLEKLWENDLNRIPKAEQEMIRLYLSTASTFLSNANVESTGRNANLQTRAELDLAKWSRIVFEPFGTNVQKQQVRVGSLPNLKMIGLAFHSYHNKHEQFPSAVMMGGKDKNVPYSWRVAILPELGLKDLYDQYNFDEPWDGPSNRKLIDRMPAVYSRPKLGGSPSSTTNSSYYVFTGPHTALADAVNHGAGRGGFSPLPILPGGRQAIGRTDDGKDLDRRQTAVAVAPSIMSITDGTSNTILAVEAECKIPWTNPSDPPLGDDPTQLSGLGYNDPNGFNALFCDGSVRFIRKTVDAKILKALITRDGGEVISRDSY